MPNSLFILLRYFLRVDNVMIRVNDTRFYHEFHQDYLLREFTSREAKVKDLHVSETAKISKFISKFLYGWSMSRNFISILYSQVPPSLFVDPSRIATHLPLTNSRYEKLIILTQATSSPEAGSGRTTESKTNEVANPESECCTQQTTSVENVQPNSTANDSVT